MSRHYIELKGNKKLIETKIKAEVVKSLKTSMKDLNNPILGMTVGYCGGFHTRDGKNHMKQLKIIKEKHEEKLNGKI